MYVITVIISVTGSVCFSVVTAVERQEFGMETAGCYSNIPAIKHSLYRLVRDLNKVKVIASYR